MQGSGELMVQGVAKFKSGVLLYPTLVQRKIMVLSIAKLESGVLQYKVTGKLWLSVTKLEDWGAAVHYIINKMFTPGQNLNLGIIHCLSERPLAAYLILDSKPAWE